MKVRNLFYLGLASVLLWNCSNQAEKAGVRLADNSIVQPENGSISLRIVNAGRYHDVTDPSNNTAEWNVVISKPGGYKVWLSSATKDTVNLKYSKSVKVNLPDNQLEVIPECDKVVQNSGDVSYPYYRADSYIGSVYFKAPGEYSIQVISEKVLPETADQRESLSEDSKLLAVILSPVTN